MHTALARRCLISFASPSTFEIAPHGPADTVAEADTTRGERARGTTDDGSTRFAGFRTALQDSDPRSLTVLALGILAALLIFATEFVTIAGVDVAEDDCEVIASLDERDRCSLSGFERHGGAFLLVALFTAAMAWGAGAGHSRPAAVALVAIGIVVLLIAFLLDLPETGKTGAIGRNFEGANGVRGPGFYMEILGGALAAASGVMALRRRGGEPDG